MTTIANITAQFAAMGKEELRAACRAAGISYGKLNNDGMRAALVAFHSKDVEAEEDEETEEVQQPTASASLFGALMGNTVTVAPVTGGTRVIDGKRVDGSVTERTARTPRDAAPVVPRATRKGYKIQVDREERNGVKRPSEGTTCGAVWAALDSLHSSPEGLKAADLPGLADDNGWNRTNVSCEYYAWRKFMGIKGRAAK